MKAMNIFVNFYEQSVGVVEERVGAYNDEMQPRNARLGGEVMIDKEYEKHFIDSYRCISLEIDTKRYRNSVKREEPM